MRSTQYRQHKSDSLSASVESDSDSLSSEDYLVEPFCNPPKQHVEARGSSNGSMPADRIKGASPSHNTNILTKLQDTRQYIDELVEENEVCYVLCVLMWTFC